MTYFWVPAHKLRTAASEQQSHYERFRSIHNDGHIIINEENYPENCTLMYYIAVVLRDNCGSVGESAVLHREGLEFHNWLLKYDTFMGKPK